MALVQVMKFAEKESFGELASKYSITSSLVSYKEVYIVFDQYWDLPIKAGERALRGSLYSCLEVKICGPSTPVPKQWGKFISNPQNKVNLYHFLSASFCDLGRQHLPQDKTLIIGGGFKTGSDGQEESSGRHI